MMNKRATEVASSFTPHDSLMEGACVETNGHCECKRAIYRDSMIMGSGVKMMLEFGTCTVGANPRVPARHRRDGAMRRKHA